MNDETIKDAGSNLTSIAEYTQTAAGLAELRKRFQGLVIDVTTPKGLKEAKTCTFELRKLRTGLEAKRKELKAPIIERGKLLDDEAKRITAEIVALEEPIDVQIKAEEARIENERLEKLEAERLRVEAINRRIDAIRAVPQTLIGKPSIIIQGQLAKLKADELSEDEFAEQFAIARDAHTASIARIEDLLQAQKEHEAEQARIKAEREELERLRAEAEARRAEDERKAAEARAEADRLAQIERDRIAEEQRQREAAERAERQRLENEARALREEQERAERAAREAELQAERERQEAERKRQADAQRLLDEQAAKLRRERQEAAEKAEAERLANLGLREAAQALIDYCDHGEPEFDRVNQLINDIRVALTNDVAESAPTVKRTPAKPVRVSREARA